MTPARKTASRSHYPEGIMLKVPKGWSAKLNRLARAREMSRSELIRAILRDFLTDFLPDTGRTKK